MNTINEEEVFSGEHGHGRFEQLRLSSVMIQVRDQDNVTTNESENGGSRRMSEDYLENEDEEEEITITAEEIERLMMFDMMRQNFKSDD